MKANGHDISAQIVDQAISLGSSVAGIANVEALKKSPSHVIIEKLAPFDGVLSYDSARVASGRQPVWTENFKSAVVIGVEHPEENPELDWWQYGQKGGTSGNSMLIDISARLSRWLETEKGYETRRLPYYVENGGVFLKDAAVLAGLGCIGKNNLFVAPDYGPRIRLRAILMDAALPAAGAMEFDPCQACDMPCRTACPQGAFKHEIYFESIFEIEALPARSGVYDRVRCNQRLEVDIGNAEMIEAGKHGKSGKVVKYCRRCEFACPVGKK